MSFCPLQSVIPFMILVVCVKSNLIVTYFVSFAAGVGVAAAFLLPWYDPRPPHGFLRTRPRPDP